jgi:Outer membrane protein beta-barrel domain
MNFNLKCLLVAMSLLSATFLISRPTWAADDPNDAYDPFIDYNEYEVEDEEEADVNFFRQGRLLTAGILVGERGFTQGMGILYKPSVTYGLYLSYFFDMRFALQFSFLASSHVVSASGTGVQDSGTPSTPGPAPFNIAGTMSLTAVSVDIKYYLNTQNLTKGIAAFNPFILGGFTGFQRQTTVNSESEFGKDTAMGFDLGLGFEVPVMQKKTYIGLEALYQIVDFSDQNTEIVTQDNTLHTGLYPNGSIVTGLGILGVNF